MAEIATPKTAREAREHAEAYRERVRTINATVVQAQTSGETAVARQTRDVGYAYIKIADDLMELGRAMDKLEKTLRG